MITTTVQCINAKDICTGNGINITTIQSLHIAPGTTNCRRLYSWGDMPQRIFGGNGTNVTGCVDPATADPAVVAAAFAAVTAVDVIIYGYCERGDCPEEYWCPPEYCNKKRIVLVEDFIPGPEDYLLSE